MFEFIEALRFLTILPIKSSFDESALKRSPRLFPLVGLFIGLLSFLSFYILSKLFSKDVSLFITIFVWESISGGIHIDGLADTLDGLMSRRDREGILEVMRDSRIGTFGALAVFFILGLKYLALKDSSNIFVSLLLSPTIARFLISLSIYLFPYARKEGKGSVFTGSLDKKNLALGFIVTLALAIIIGRLRGLIALLSGLFFGYLFSMYLNWRIGGLTGDNYGAICEFTEAIVLLTL